jgi:methyl-accepting chemotaxis protein
MRRSVNCAVLIYTRSARGNTSLESALQLTKEIRHEIEKLGKRMESLSDQMQKRKTSPDEVKSVVEDIRVLLHKIEDVCF